MSHKEIIDLIHQLSYNPRNRLELFLSQELTVQADILMRLTKHVQYDLVKKLPKEQLLSLLEQLDPDEATDVIQLLPPKKQEKIVQELNQELRENISELLKFDPDTAAGIMNVDYIQVNSKDTIAEVSKQVKVHEKRTGKLPTILVLEEGRLSGHLPGHELGFGKTFEQARKYIQKIPTIGYKAKHDQLIALFQSHPHNKVVVLGDEGNVMGVIYSDDILRIMQEQTAASLYDFAGLSDEESIYDGIRRKVNFRYKWLLINLATAFLAAFTVKLFDETISKHVLLAVYMPIVAGMGGNAATQTLAVLVRGLSHNKLTFQTLLKTLKSEVGAGLVNGVINGVVVVGVVFLISKDLKIGLVLAMAMIINLFTAAFFGTLIPVVMKRLGKDPASSATVFITTATDVLGFLAFLGLATIFL